MAVWRSRSAASRGASRTGDRLARRGCIDRRRASDDGEAVPRRGSGDEGVAGGPVRLSDMPAGRHGGGGGGETGRLRSTWMGEEQVRGER